MIKYYSVLGLITFLTLNITCLIYAIKHKKSFPAEISFLWIFTDFLCLMLYFCNETPTPKSVQVVDQINVTAAKIIIYLFSLITIVRMINIKYNFQNLNFEHTFEDVWLAFLILFSILYVYICTIVLWFKLCVIIYEKWFKKSTLKSNTENNLEHELLL